MRQLLEAGEAGLSFARACVAGGKWRVALATVKLLAPIYDPEKIVCVCMLGLGLGLGLGFGSGLGSGLGLGSGSGLAVRSGLRVGSGLGLWLGSGGGRRATTVLPWL